MIAVMVLALAVTAWATGDARATRLVTGPELPAPAETAAVPSTVTPLWRADYAGDVRAVASVYGSVVLPGTDSLRGLDAATGTEWWSYRRTGDALCGIGDGDTVADGLDSWSGVHGVLSVFAKNGWCSQVTLHHPTSGARLAQRTSPNPDPGALFYGAPYVGWLGADYLELWRHDLVATIRYGNQPNPVNASGPRLHCTFTDAAVTAMNLATIEHCPEESATALLVLNWPTPSDAPGDDDWDANHSQPRVVIDTESPEAVLLTVTQDGAAILVTAPEPAVVIYDVDGRQIARTATQIPAAAIAAAARTGITPVRTYHDIRYALVDSHLFAFGAETVDAPPAREPDAADPSTEEMADENADEVTDDETGEDLPATREHPVLRWVADGAIGLPATLPAQIVLPTASGWSIRSAADGAEAGRVAVPRGDVSGRIDLTAIGDVFVEVADATVVAYHG